MGQLKNSSYGKVAIIGANIFEIHIPSLSISWRLHMHFYQGNFEGLTNPVHCLISWRNMSFACSNKKGAIFWKTPLDQLLKLVCGFKLNMRAKSLFEQFKKRWIVTAMWCVVWKNHLESIFHKEKSEMNIQFSTKMFMEQISNLD